ncbi:MAG: hypothetical protein PHU85_04425, partial [Phycisphaerae bacterium]|nr:hypothetical protein [Phycisphaerae bacterium]
LFRSHCLGVAFSQYVSAHQVYPTYGSSATQRARNYTLADPGVEDWTALYVENYVPSIQTFFCPGMKSKTHQYDNPQNPWSSGSMRTGYSRRYFTFPGGTLTHVSRVGPGQAMAADLLISPSRLKFQHESGDNVLYASGRVLYRTDVAELFTAAGVSATATANNAQLDQVWADLDLGAGQ